MSLVTGLYQFSRDVQLLPIALYAALQQVGNTQLAADLIDAFGCSLVFHRRCARNNSQVPGTETAEVHDQFISNAVAEVFLLRIAGEILEGKHCQHDAGRSRSELGLVSPGSSRDNNNTKDHEQHCQDCRRPEHDAAAHFPVRY